MTPKERVFARLSGKPVDRIPNFSILMSFAARFYGRGMDEFCRDHKVMAEANLAAAEHFGIDLLSTMSDAYRETADYGAAIRFPLDELPVCEHLIASEEDVRKLRPFKLESSIRMLDRMKAIELYKREAGDHWPILGWVEGMAAEASDLMGLESLIYAIYDEPSMVREIMEICEETALDCIRGQIAAGADIIGVGDAAASVLGPDIYRNFVLRHEQRLFAEIRRLGAVGRLHICGDVTPLMDDLRHCGADIIDIDYMVDFASARDRLADVASLCGNYDPVQVVLEGTPETVAEAVNNCCDTGGDRSFIMAGCEIPRDTPHENLLAVAEALTLRR